MEARQSMGTRYRPTANPVSWEKTKFIDSFLAKKLSTGSVSLVIGAGVSMGFKLPSWDDLVKEIYLKKGEPLPTKPSSAPAMSMSIKRKHYKGADLEFSRLVRDCLYSKFDKTPSLLLSSPLLQAVGTFLVSSMRGRANSLISFNFDDLIETYLRLLGFVVRSEHTAPYWTVNADMHVLHPHGILPQDERKPCTDIVFTENDYDRVIGKDANAWNQKIKSILGGTTAVFLGLSGDDQRLRSLLLEVKAIHPAILKDGHPYWAVRPTTASEDQTNVDRWRDLGVAPIQLTGFDDLPAWLLSICQKSANTVAPSAK
jgi:SIR2-like domain